MHHLTTSRPVPVFSLSTLDFPKADRFGMWVSDLISDTRWSAKGTVPFNAEARGAALGPIILTRRIWLSPHRRTRYEFYRTQRRIRLDGQESFRFLLPLKGKIFTRVASLQSTKMPNDLFLLDDARQLELCCEFGEVLSLAIPRDFLPYQASRLHGQTLSSGVGRLLSDHMQSLFRNLTALTEDEVPNVVQSTIQLLCAAVAPTQDRLSEAAEPLAEAMQVRVLKYIEAHWAESSLTPLKICRGVGLSRSKLYQLFERSGGVMRQIQHKRLIQAYRALSNPGRTENRISEIALNHGFSNEKYFYRLFKTEFGHTPRETVQYAIASSTFPHRSNPDEVLENRGPLGWTLPFGMRP